jgi:hypothetical protein
MNARPGWVTSALLTATVLVLGATARAQIGAPVGPTFLVNSYTTGDQINPSIGADASGGFVVAWQGLEEDGNGWGIFARRHLADGAAKGPSFAVNSTTKEHQAYPRVASSPAGEFLVVWDSFGQDGSSFGAFGQRYDASGDPHGPEFAVNTHTTSSQSNPAAAWSANGSNVVVWQSEGQDGDLFGVFARRYDAAGTPDGPEFQVNSYTTGEQAYPVVAAAPDGGFVVVWEDFSQDQSRLGVFGQVFDDTGAPTGAEFRINAYTTGLQLAPAVARTPGGFVVVWHGANQDGSGLGVLGRRFGATGTPLGEEFVVNSFTSGHQGLPSVAADPSGAFVVVWLSGGEQGNGVGLFGQLYDAQGNRAGAEFAVLAFPFVSFARVAASDRGFVVAWPAQSDGGGYGIFAQRYRGDLIFADGFE